MLHKFILLNIIDDIVSLLECDEKPGCPEVSESSLWDGGTVTPDTGLSDLQNVAKGFSGILDNLKMLDFKAPSLSFGDLFGAGGCNSGPVACGPPIVKFFGGAGSGAADIRGRRVRTATGFSISFFKLEFTRVSRNTSHKERDAR